MREASAPRGGRRSLHGALVAAMVCAVAVCAPLGIVKVPFALALVCVLPGWLLFGALDDRWPQRHRVAKGALAAVGSAAVVPLVLYWTGLGHGLSAPRVAAALLGWCVAMGGLAAVSQWRVRARSAGTGLARVQLEGASPPSPGAQAGAERLSRRGLRPALVVVVAAVVFAVLISVPWLPNGRRLEGGVAQSPCSGDWSKHRSLTYAILDTGIPPRNPFVGQKELTYYYGLYLQAAALVRLGGGLGVDASLWSLSVVLALATVPVLWVLGIAAGARPMAAALGSAVVTLVGGLDVVVLWLLRAFPELGYWETGHSGVWATAPRVPFLFANLHWAPQHHGAALMALVSLWLVLHPRRQVWGTLALAGVMVGGAFVCSAYVGLVLTGAWVAGAVLVAGWGLWRRDVAGLTRAGLLVGAVALGGLSASGILGAERHMVSNERTHLSLALPRLDYADWMVRVTAEGLARPAGLAGAAGFEARRPSPRTAWMSGPGWGAAIRTFGGVVGVCMQLGLVGLLGLWGLPGSWREGHRLWLVVLGVTWVVALFVANFDLQMRSAGLGWMLLAGLVARGLDRSWEAGPRGSRLRCRVAAAFLVLGVPGLGCLAWDVAGASRPVYFDASDVALMAWVRSHTPEGSVVQAYPDTAPRIVAMPSPRFFVWPSFPEFTGRCAVLGDSAHARMFCTPEEHVRYWRALQAAFEADSSGQTAELLAALNVDLVLWTSRESQRGAAGLRRRLLDGRYFELLHSEGNSFVVRLRHVSEMMQPPRLRSTSAKRDRDGYGRAHTTGT